MAWFKRFGLHLAAAVGATGVFVAAAAVGASQTREQTPTVRSGTQAPSHTRTPIVRRTPTPVVELPPAASGGSPAPTAPVSPPSSTDGATSAPPQAPAPTGPRGSAPARAASAVAPERSLSGTIREVEPDGLLVVTVRGREWHIRPAPAALIRLNGHATHLDSLQPGDRVVILGQAQGKDQFLAHAITARRR